MKTILPAFLFFAIPLLSNGQLPKKELKALEKQAREIPAGGLSISLGGVRYMEVADTVYGELSAPDSSGWQAYEAKVTNGKLIPDMHTIEYSMQRRFPSFYMSATEVSNQEYRNYENWVRKNDSAALGKILPDTALWRRGDVYYQEPLKTYYYRHPAYANYSVVNVSYDQVLAYLAWLTDQYNSAPGRKYNKVKFRLPSEEEWLYAYLGGAAEHTVTNYGWFRNTKGLMTANFKNTLPAWVIQLQEGDSILLQMAKANPKQPGYIVLGGTPYDHIPSGLSETNFCIAPCRSYWPNEYGLWNMTGNVAEFVSNEGVVKGGHWNSTGFYLMPLSRETYLGQNSASPTRGFRWVMELIEE